jgi:hypothetical protein
MHRRFYYVVRDHDRGSLYLGGALIGRHDSAEAAVAAAKRLAVGGLLDGGEAEVLVQEDDGRYRVEWMSPRERPTRA